MRVKPVGASTSGMGNGRPSNVVDGIDRADVAQDPRPEADAGIGRCVRGQRAFVLGPAVDVVEHATRQPAARDAAQVGDVHAARAGGPPGRARTGPKRNTERSVSIIRARYARIDQSVSSASPARPCFQ